METETYVTGHQNQTVCQVCGRKAETRLGACWNCVEAESIIATGVDMYDKGIDGTEIPAKNAMQKLKLLINKGWKS